MYDHLYDTLRFDWLVFLIELTTLGRIHTPQQPLFNSTGDNRGFELENTKNKAKSPGYTTIWYQERRDTPRRRVESGKERGAREGSQRVRQDRGSRSGRWWPAKQGSRGESGSIKGREVESRGPKKIKYLRVSSPSDLFDLKYRFHIQEYRTVNCQCVDLAHENGTVCVYQQKKLRTKN